MIFSYLCNENYLKSWLLVQETTLIFFSLKQMPPPPKKKSPSDDVGRAGRVKVLWLLCCEWVTQLHPQFFLDRQAQLCLLF